MGRASQWWKVALQVNGYGPNFSLPEDWSSRGLPDPQTSAGMRAFAEHYVEAFAQANYGAIAVTDHNSIEWYTTLRDVASDYGIVVFPGCEITCGSGSDGVHLLIIGDPDSDDSAFNEVLSGACGFGFDHPAFDPATGYPLPARHSLMHILENLPPCFLAIAPHAFNDNGLLSGKTLNGAMRWKAFHADALMAIDIGDPREAKPGSYREKIAARSLDNYPGLTDMPFVNAPDVYNFDSVRGAFTYLRMAHPTFEGLRQAFLDHEARVKPAWKLPSGDYDPNHVEHAWIESISFQGDIGVSSDDIRVDFDPHLNVLIGGRGSGKSTVVAGIRQVYCAEDPLPQTLQREWDSFTESAFRNAEIESQHKLAISGEAQSVSWTLASGSRTRTLDGSTSASVPPVRVVSQKELFELTLAAGEDHSSVSRGLLHFIDSTLGIDARQDHLSASVPARIRRRQSEWREAVREVRRLKATVAALEQVTARLGEVNRQIEALEDPEQAEAVDAARSTLLLHARNAAGGEDIRQAIERVSREASELRALGVEASPEAATPTDQGHQSTPAEAGQSTGHAWRDQVVGVAKQLAVDIETAAKTATDSLAALDEAFPDSDWAAEVAAAERRLEDYRRHLEDRGVAPDSYQDLLTERRNLDDQIDEAEAAIADLEDARNRCEEAWKGFVDVLDERASLREDLINQVGEDVDFLRVDFTRRSDASSWVRQLRESAGLRADAYISEVQGVVGWMLDQSVDHDTRESRRESWMNFLLNGDMSDAEPIVESTGIRRRPFWQRLAELDDDVRIMLAGAMPDDLLEFYFRSSVADGSREEGWQPISQGSPGQRGAAMLSFVLAHGSGPLVLDQPEDDLDSEWISNLVVEHLRDVRTSRQVIVATHNANIPVNGDAERVIVLENSQGVIGVRSSRDATPCTGPIEVESVRASIQDIMEGGVNAFVRRELKYNNELNTYRAARGQVPQ